MNTAHGAEQEEDGHVGGGGIHNARSIWNRDPWIFSNETLRKLSKKKRTSIQGGPTFGGAGIGIDLIISRTVMGYKPEVVRKHIDQFLVKSPRQLTTTRCGQLQSHRMLRSVAIHADLDRIKGSQDSQDSIVDSRFAVGQKLVSASFAELLQGQANTN